MAPAPANLAPLAPVFIEQLRIQNFRGLDKCTIELETGLTLLVGRNNAGKSRVLRALGIALGGLPAELDDLTVGDESPAIIDIVVAPTPPPTEADEDVFAVPVGQRLVTQPQVIREEPMQERFAWRTTIAPSAEGFGARTEMHLLVFDQSTNQWALPPNAPALTREQRSLFLADLIDARRDLVEELARRGSPIRRVLSDLEVSEPARSEIEGQLSVLGTRIVNESDTLQAISRALDEVEKHVGGIGAPALSPLPVRLEELARSVAIDLDAGTGPLPVRLHGAGARSLTSLRVQGLLYDRRIGQDGPALRPHPLTLIEEPEAHLHPQANLELVALLSSLPGQVVASTHSSHLVTAADPRAVRLIRQQAGTRVVDLGPDPADDPGRPRAFRPSLHAQEWAKLRRLVERPFGELLFASAIVMGDGATERAFFPVALRHALKGKAHGVCVIDPGSMRSELAMAAIKFAQVADIPWFLFCDSDGEGRAAAEQLVNAHAGGDQSRLVWAAPAALGGSGGAIERLLTEFDRQACMDACRELRPDVDVNADVFDLMKQMKGTIGAALGRRLVERHDDHSQWPVPLRELIERLDAVL